MNSTLRWGGLGLQGPGDWGWGRSSGRREGLPGSRGGDLPARGAEISRAPELAPPPQPGLTPLTAARPASRLLPLSPRRKPRPQEPPHPRPATARAKPGGRSRPASDGTAGCVANRLGPRADGLGPAPRTQGQWGTGAGGPGGVRGREAPPCPPLSPLPRPFPPGPPAPRSCWCRSSRWARPRPSRRPASAPHGSCLPSLLLSLTPSAMAAGAAEQQQFYLLLGNLLSPDNVVRKQAEVTELAPPGPRLRAPAGAPILPATPPAGPWPLSRGGAGRAGRAAAAQPTCESAVGSQRCPPGPSGPCSRGASCLPVAARAHVRPLLTSCPRPDGEAGRRGGVWGVGRAPGLPSPLSRFIPLGASPGLPAAVPPCPALWSPKPWLLPDPSPLLLSCPSLLTHRLPLASPSLPIEMCLAFSPSFHLFTFSPLSRSGS